jgi:uncharacterized protein
MKIEEKYPHYDFVIVPGFNGSGPLHWQSLWESENPGFKRVEQSDWDNPEKNIWVEAFINCLETCQKPIIVIAHSLGVATFLHAYEKTNHLNIAAAFLVAMPDVNKVGFPKEIVGFYSIPTNKLNLISYYIASENDHYISIDRSKEWADSIGSKFINVGKHDHIGTAANLGEWKEGQEILIQMLQEL